MFIAIKGERRDGHEFLPAAAARGAVAALVEYPPAKELPNLHLIGVDNTRRAMADAADAFFGRPTERLDVAGVTGTNGKTTTAHLLHAVLAAAGRRPGLIGTVETRVGDETRPAVRTTPEAIDLQRTFREMLDAGNLSCAMEATSHGSELHRLDHVRFRVLVFTNLTQDHLDFHGTIERYYDAKRRLFSPGVPAAVNVGDEYGRRLAEELPAALTYGFADDAAVGPDALAGIELRLRGRVNHENAHGARAAARLLGVDDGTARRALASVVAVPGRFEEVDEGQPFTVLVDYAHTPDALENVLLAARDLGGRLLCVFGAGGDRDREKRPVMGRIAAEHADVAIVTSDNPRSERPEAIIDEIVAGGDGGLEVEPDRRRAIERALEEARPGDVVVIAGKGHEQGQEIAGRRLPFDDRDVAREALRRLGVGA